MTDLLKNKLYEINCDQNLFETNNLKSQNSGFY